MRRRIITIALSLIVLAVTSPVTAQDDPNSAKITSPTAGEPLSGLVLIKGTASHPNMARYLLQFDSQDSEVENWLPIAGPILQQVKDGVLGQWNTTSIPDGRYQIRLRVILRDGTVLTDVVQNLRIINKQPTPLPTNPPPATAIPPTVPPTAGPSPTPFIQQPPTSTPRPAVLAVPPTAVEPNPAPDVPQAVVALDAVQNAFCAGIYLAFAAFAILIVYSLLHARIRPAARRMIRRDYRD